MKNSKEIAAAVFLARDAYNAQQKIRNGHIKKAAAVSAAACTLCLTVTGVGYWNAMQTRLPAVSPDAKMEEAIGKAEEGTFPKCLSEESETAVLATAAASDHKVMPEDPIEVLPETEPVQIHFPAFEGCTELPQTTAFEGCTEPPQTTAAAETNAPITQNTEASTSRTEAPPAPSVQTETQTTEEFVKVPQWDEKTISEQFVEFTVNDAVYVTRCAEIDNADVGEKLCDVVVTGFDDYADEVRYADAEVYRINGISEECAVSVRFQGYDTGYVYTSRSYLPATLGELMDALNLTETVSFHTLYAGQDTTGILEYDRSLLMELLNTHRETAREENDSHHKPLFGVSTNIDLLGITNKSLRVTEDGYLITNIMERGYAFYLGEDTTASLAQALGIESIAPTAAATGDADIEASSANADIVYE